MKKVLARLLVLAKVYPGNTLYLYYAVSEDAVSSILLKKDEEGIQRPIFFTSRVLRGAESRYSEVEKKALAIVCAAWRLRSYLQVHHVVVLISNPFRKILHRQVTAERLIP